AFQFRFPDNNLEADSRPAIAQFDYRGILLAIILSWLFIFIVSGIYRFKHANLFVLNLQLVIKRSIYFFFFLGFVSFILKASFSRIVFAVMLTSGLLYLLLGRLLTYFIFLKPLILKKKIISKMMIVGKSSKELKDHSEWIIENRNLGYSVVSRVECKQISSEWIEEFDRILRYKKIDEVLLLPGMESDKNFSKFIHYCEDLEININWIPLDSGNLGYWLIPTAQEGIPFLTFEKSAISLPWRFAKRVFDLIFATLFLLIFSPVLLLIAILVLLSSGWPILYSQTRVGLNGKTFKFYKFRSMIKDADQRLSEVENVHKRDHVIFKSKDDPRVTPIGKILRKYSLDELPQFFNVLNNSMSVVGPRPALTREVSLYNSTYERRLNAKPGITGPWQISGRSDLDLQTSISLDLNYLTNWSFTRD
ncbi:MAG: exopolysaccharide biosynthesis polyprenyl glycosylphosphotransferase, partial [Actinobacteria bacterium]|nr:exopolysaccharide biosynthesis polyprenyl glycosylphosphotransferase [Actinomycetota bacterium]